MISNTTPDIRLPAQVLFWGIKQNLGGSKQ